MSSVKPCIRCGSQDRYDPREGQNIGRCRPCHRRAQRKWYANNPQHAKKRIRIGWLKQYGLTPAEYTSIADSQEWVCAICNQENHGGKRLCIDHCHDEGHVRGLLCTSCNAALGHFQDDSNLLIRAAAYLEDNGSQLKGVLHDG